MPRKITMKSIEELEDGELIQFVGVHVLKWEKLMHEYGIPEWDYAFTIEDDEINE